MNTPSQELIDAIKEKTPKKAELVNKLMDILPIGKEAIYRRLRGEIPFTLHEAVLICKNLKISLDVLMKIEHEDNYTFHIMDIFMDGKMDEFHRMLMQIISSIEYVILDPKAFSYRVHHIFPQDFSFKYETLSKLFLYIIFYQLYPDPVNRSLESINFPQKVIDVMKESVITVHNIDSSVIFDNYCFQMFVDAVKYYQSLNLVNDETVKKIKEELYLLIDDIERSAVTGLSSQGKKMNIYISHVYLDSSYSYIEGNGFKAGSVQIYEADYLTSENTKINKRHKQWIEALLRFSTLISVSGEKQRNFYLKNQRAVISTL